MSHFPTHKRNVTIICTRSYSCANNHILDLTKKQTLLKRIT
eukprot:UN13718